MCNSAHVSMCSYVLTMSICVNSAHVSVFIHVCMHPLCPCVYIDISLYHVCQLCLCESQFISMSNISISICVSSGLCQSMFMCINPCL